MNIHDYWVQSLMQQRGQQGQPQGSPMPDMAPSPMPQYSSVSPLVSGSAAAQEAIRNARQEKQSSIASGLFDTLGSVLSNYSLGQLRTSPVPSARAVGSMMKTLDEKAYEKRQEEQANRLLALKYLDKQMERERREQRESALDSYRERALSERARHNVGMESRVGKGRDGGKKLSAKLENKVSLVDAAKRQLRTISDTFNEFKKETEGNVFSPFLSVTGVNKAKEYISARAGKQFPKIARENVLRSRLHSEIMKLDPLVESIEAQKAPGEQMLKRFHNAKVFFSLDQPMDVFEDKLVDLTNELENTKRSVTGGEYVGRHTSSGNGAAPDKSAVFNPDVLKEAERQLSSEKGGFSKAALDQAKKEMAAGR